MTFAQLAALLGLPAPPPDPPAAWQPTYQPQQFIVVPMGPGQSIDVPVNTQYLPDAATVAHLKPLYNPLGTSVLTPLIPAGPDSGPSIPTFVWPNGKTMMVGILAAFYTDNSDDAQVADALCRAAIAGLGAK